MIACVFDSGSAAFVEPAVQDIARFAKTRGVDLIGVCIDRMAAPHSNVSQVYVLPFDAADAVQSRAMLAQAFPSGQAANSLAAHELATDRIALGERLLERGVAIPEALVTDDPEEARAFIARCGHAVLRDVRSGRRGGSLVVVCGDDRVVAGESRGRRYVVELSAAVDRIQLQHGVLTYPPPYFAQRLITRVGRQGVLMPAPVQRAFVVDEDIPFWIEAYRDRARRPSDFLVDPAAGASRRFVQVVSDEAEKLVRRVSKVVGFAFGAVDIVRSDSGYVILDVVTDGRHGMIDRSFKALPEHRDAFDLDRHIALALADRCP